MYKVHQPHIASRYLTQVHYEATTDDDGQPDWLIHYTPGPKARAEYAIAIQKATTRVQSINFAMQSAATYARAESTWPRWSSK